MIQRYLIKDFLISAEIEDNFLQIKIENKILYEYRNEKSSTVENTIKKLLIAGVLHYIRSAIKVSSKNLSWDELIEECNNRIYCDK